MQEAHRESKKETDKEPMASVAAAMRSRWRSKAPIPAAKTGNAGTSQRF